MDKIATKKAPEAIGPYSQAVRVGGLLFVSGQLPIDPITRKIVRGDIGVMTRRILKNIEAILEEAGVELDDIVKATIFLKDMEDYSEVNREYGTHFSGPIFPARETVQVSALPLGARIEISCVASLGGE